MSALIDIAIQQVLFFATVPDADVQPDVAVSQLELLVTELNELPVKEHSLVRSRVRERISEASGPERDALVELDAMLG